MYYGIGGDFNVDEFKDVIFIIECLGLWYLQEGIVNGYFNFICGDKVKIIGQLCYGCVKIVEDFCFVFDGYKYVVVDLIIGFGVVELVCYFYEIYYGIFLEGKIVIIQGWGNVVLVVVSYFLFLGVCIFGIIDWEGGVISWEGLGMEEVKEFFVCKQGNKFVVDELLLFEEVNEKIWFLGVDIFILGVVLKLVICEQVEQLVEGGVEVIFCGVNVFFVDDGVFFGLIVVWMDQ